MEEMQPVVLEGTEVLCEKGRYLHETFSKFGLSGITCQTKCTIRQLINFFSCSFVT